MIERDSWSARGKLHSCSSLNAPISSAGKDYVVDPIKALRSVCPNCHAMLHKEGPSLTTSQLKKYRFGI